jgi:hypothetical protein
MIKKKRTTRTTRISCTKYESRALNNVTNVNTVGSRAIANASEFCPA